METKSGRIGSADPATHEPGQSALPRPDGECPLRGAAYLDSAIDSFDRDPPDTDFQRGYLEALKVVRNEAFTPVPGDFAKIFDTPHGQLLAYLDYENGDDEYTVVAVGASVGDVIPKATLGYRTEAEQRRGFAKIDQDGAEDMAARFHTMVAGLAVQA